MTMLVAFAVGYVMGARGGSEEFDEVVESIKAILGSEAFSDFVAALRFHAAHTLREVAAMLERPRAGSGGTDTPDLVQQVNSLINRT